MDSGSSSKIKHFCGLQKKGNSSQYQCQFTHSDGKRCTLKFWPLSCPDDEGKRQCRVLYILECREKGWYSHLSTCANLLCDKLGLSLEQRKALDYDGVEEKLNLFPGSDHVQKFHNHNCNNKHICRGEMYVGCNKPITNPAFKELEEKIPTTKKRSVPKRDASKKRKREEFDYDDTDEEDFQPKKKKTFAIKHFSLPIIKKEKKPVILDELSDDEVPPESRAFQKGKKEFKIYPSEENTQQKIKFLELENQKKNLENEQLRLQLQKEDAEIKKMLIQKFFG